MQGRPWCQPIQTEFIANGERPPANKHGVQGGSCWSRGPRPPPDYVSVHEMLGGVECLAVRPNDLLARLCAAPPWDALEGRAASEQAPKPVLQTERGLDNELGQVVRKVSARGHRCPLKTLALWGPRRPRAQASIVHLVERHLHAHMDPREPCHKMGRLAQGAALRFER